jgi:hypothetical protein
MYSSVESASHREQQIKDVGRGRWNACAVKVPTKEVKDDGLFLRIASFKSQACMFGLMDDWRLCMYSAGKGLSLMLKEWRTWLRAEYQADGRAAVGAGCSASLLARDYLSWGILFDQ